jgi:hypothetical protein
VVPRIEGASDAYPLLHSRRHLPGVTIAHPGQAHCVEVRVGDGRRVPAHLAEGEADVVTVR